MHSKSRRLVRAFSYIAILFLASFAWGQSAPVVTTDSVSPQNGSGGSQIFTFVFSDSNGYQDLLNRFPHVIFSGGSTGSGNGGSYCWLGISSTGAILAQDDLSMAWKSVTFGSNTIAQNSQCTISGMGSSLTASGNTVTVNLSIIFRPAYAGMKTISTDVNNSGQGYAEVGTFNVTPTAPDYTVTVSPSSQNIQAGDTATYTVTVTPVNGFNEDITLSQTTYNSGGGDATGVSGALNPTVISGGSGTSTLTVTSPPSIPTSTWQSTVTGTAPSGTRVSNPVQTAVAAPPPPPPPALTAAVSPQNGSGGSQVFTFTFTDSNGSQDLINRFPHVIFSGNSTGSGNGGSYCWLGIYSTGFILAPDNLSMAWKGGTFGSSDFVQNSQCTVSGAGSSISESGNTVTVNLAITFLPAYAGVKTIESDVNANGYTSIGTFNVTPTAPDFTISVAPSSQNIQAGQNATYTVTVTPVNGFNQDITLSQTTFNSGGGDVTGVSGSLSPTVISGGGGTSTLTVTSPASTGTSTWQSSVTGTSPSITHVSNVVQTGVTGAPPPPPPTLTAAVSPQNGSGGSQVFTFTFTDSNGSQDFFTRTAHIIFSGTSTGSKNGEKYCWLLFGQTGAALAQDDLSQAWQFVTFGTNSVAQNSQCTINGAGSSVTVSGNTVTLNLSVTFRPEYAGAATISTDVNANGYAAIGTFNVTATAPDFTLTVSPSSQSVQSGDSATYTVTATPVNGFNQPITLSVETINSGGGDATGVSGTLNPTVIPGGSGTSTLTATTPSSIAASTWSFIVTGTSASGTRTANTAQLSVTGPAQPPPPPPPTLTTSVSPQNASGSSQVFTFQFSDSNGYQDLLSGKYHILINTTPNGTSSCWMLLQSTGLSLAPDDPGQTWLFVPYGASATAQNSQCGVSGIGTSISGSGNDLTLSLTLSFTPAYDGARNVYTDVNSSNPGYVAATTYTVQ